jgi:hypothetical protein
MLRNSGNRCSLYRTFYASPVLKRREEKRRKKRRIEKMRGEEKRREESKREE